MSCEFHGQKQLRWHTVQLWKWFSSQVPVFILICPNRSLASRVSHLSPSVNTQFCLILSVPTFLEKNNQSWTQTRLHCQSSHNLGSEQTDPLVQILLCGGRSGLAWGIIINLWRYLSQVLWSLHCVIYARHLIIFFFVLYVIWTNSSKALNSFENNTFDYVTDRLEN